MGFQLSLYPFICLPNLEIKGLESKWFLLTQIGFNGNWVGSREIDEKERVKEVDIERVEDGDRDMDNDV